MNVLGVIFDSKLNWQIQTSHAISKAKKALFALRAIKKYFTFTQMRALLDSNFYSVLYYNSCIWLNTFISPDCKQKLLSISANALRTCLKYSTFDVSFIDIHRISKKCMPSHIMRYNQAIQLFKTINHVEFPSTFEDITLVDQMVCTGRQLKFKTFRNNTLKIGLNMSANKLHCVSDLISFDLLNLSFVHYKKMAKIQFLKFGKT